MEKLSTRRTTWPRDAPLVSPIALFSLPAAVHPRALPSGADAGDLQDTELLAAERPDAAADAREAPRRAARSGVSALPPPCPRCLRARQRLKRLLAISKAIAINQELNKSITVS